MAQAEGAVLVDTTDREIDEIVADLAARLPAAPADVARMAGDAVNTDDIGNIAPKATDGR